VADLDDPVPAAFAADGDLPLPQIEVVGLQVAGFVPQGGQLGQPDAGRGGTAMIAVSRRWANVRPAHACSSRVSFSG
jgi:hypothetical protein